MKGIQKALEVFSWKDLKTAKKVISKLFSYGYEIKDFMDFIKIKQEDLEKKTAFLSKWIGLHKDCPKCGKKMALFRIKEENPNNYKSRWVCVNNDCDFIEIFNKETAEEAFEKNKIEVKDNGRF